MNLVMGFSLSVPPTRWRSRDGPSPIIASNVAPMRLLTLRDFELLVDLVFTSSGLQRIGDVAVSFHPAGHVLGSTQIALEHKDLGRAVVTGDYSRVPNPACAPF